MTHKTTAQLAQQWGYDSQFINKVARREKLGTLLGKGRLRVFTPFDEERLRACLERNCRDGRSFPRFTEDLGVQDLPKLEANPSYQARYRLKKAQERLRQQKGED